MVCILKLLHTFKIQSSLASRNDKAFYGDQLQSFGAKSILKICCLYHQGFMSLMMETDMACEIFNTSCSQLMQLFAVEDFITLCDIIYRAESEIYDECVYFVGINLNGSDRIVYS
jgi:hypothetical protein